MPPPLQKLEKVHARCLPASVLEAEGTCGEGLTPASGGSRSSGSFNEGIVSKDASRMTSPLDFLLRAASMEEKSHEPEGKVAASKVPLKKAPPSASDLAMMRLTEELREIEDKEAYMQAVSRAPEIMETESNPAMFLRLEDNLVRPAARRLVEYWKQRVFFLQDRAFRPVLDLTGAGALTKKEIALLRTGSCVKLPDHPNGRPVLYCDDSKFPANIVQISEIRRRCLFYWVTLAATTTPLAQTEGIIMIRLIRRAEIDLKSAQSIGLAMAEAMPVKISAFHFCCIPPAGRRKHFSETFVPILIQRLGKTIGSRASIHVERKKGDLFYKLSLLGFKKDDLPTSLGGRWSYNCLQEWLDSETRSDEADPELGALSNLAAAAEQARINERKARKRKMDALYARKRRKREKEEEKELRKKCSDLSKINMKLEVENSKLEQVLAEANTNVFLIEHGTVNARSKRKNIGKAMGSEPKKRKAKRNKAAAIDPFHFRARLEEHPQDKASILGFKPRAISRDSTSSKLPDHAAYDLDLLCAKGSSKVLKHPLYDATISAAKSQPILETLTHPKMPGDTAARLNASHIEDHDQLYHLSQTIASMLEPAFRPVSQACASYQNPDNATLMQLLSGEAAKDSVQGARKTSQQLSNIQAMLQQQFQTEQQASQQTVASQQFLWLLLTAAQNNERQQVQAQQQSLMNGDQQILMLLQTVAQRVSSNQGLNSHQDQNLKRLLRLILTTSPNNHQHQSVLQASLLQRILQVNAAAAAPSTFHQPFSVLQSSSPPPLTNQQHSVQQLLLASVAAGDATLQQNLLQSLLSAVSFQGFM